MKTLRNIRYFCRTDGVGLGGGGGVVGLGWVGLDGGGGGVFTNFFSFLFCRYGSFL